MWLMWNSAKEFVLALWNGWILIIIINNHIVNWTVAVGYQLQIVLWQNLFFFLFISFQMMDVQWWVFVCNSQIIANFWLISLSKAENKNKVVFSFLDLLEYYSTNKVLIDLHDCFDFVWK